MDKSLDEDAVAAHGGDMVHDLMERSPRCRHGMEINL